MKYLLVLLWFIPDLMDGPQVLVRDAWFSTYEECAIEHGVVLEQFEERDHLQYIIQLSCEGVESKVDDTAA